MCLPELNDSWTPELVLLWPVLFVSLSIKPVPTWSAPESGSCQHNGPVIAVRRLSRFSILYANLCSELRLELLGSSEGGQICVEIKIKAIGSWLILLVLLGMQAQVCLFGSLKLTLCIVWCKGHLYTFSLINSWVQDMFVSSLIQGQCIHCNTCIHPPDAACRLMTHMPSILTNIIRGLRILLCS